MNTLVYIFGAVVLIYTLLQYRRIRRSWKVSDELIAEAQAVSQTVDDPSRRVLIIGDSLWAGVGAKDPTDSLAGLLAADLPEAEIVNQAESGARIADGLAQLKTALEAGGEFDQIIIQLGANDILNISPLSQAKADLRKLLNVAQANAPDVAYMVSGSIGFAPVFWLPLDWFYTALSRWYLKEFADVSGAAGVLYIDLYRPRREDPFYGNPEKYYAADKFHPSGAGYGIWYKKCRNELQCFAYDEADAIEELAR